MTLSNPRIFWMLALLLSGCSSPPEPAKVPWNIQLLTLNETQPLWVENNNVIPSALIAGHWTKVIRNFNGTGGPWPPDIWYALTHSTSVTISAPDAETFFATKLWLRNHGVKGVIRYRQGTPLMLYRSTDIYLTR